MTARPGATSIWGKRSPGKADLIRGQPGQATITFGPDVEVRKDWYGNVMSVEVSNWFNS
jgi:hypothetical protein